MSKCPKRAQGSEFTVPVLLFQDEDPWGEFCWWYRIITTNLMYTVWTKVSPTYKYLHGVSLTKRSKLTLVTSYKSSSLRTCVETFLFSKVSFICHFILLTLYDTRVGSWTDSFINSWMTVHESFVFTATRELHKTDSIYLCFFCKLVILRVIILYIVHNG